MATEVEAPVTEEETPSNTYVIRPNFQNKFRPIMVREAIHHVLTDELKDREYDAAQVTELQKTLADKVKTSLKDMGYERYKFVVQVVIGEQRGEGVKMGCRCFWDSDTDNYAQDVFMNESLFCVVAAFGVYQY